MRVPPALRIRAGHFILTNRKLNQHHFLYFAGSMRWGAGVLQRAAGLGQANRAAGVMDEETNSVRGCNAGDEWRCFAGAERGAKRSAIDGDSRGQADRRRERIAEEESAYFRERRAHRESSRGFGGDTGGDEVDRSFERDGAGGGGRWG